MPERGFRILRCAVCDFPFSDRHHTYPQSSGGSRSQVIPLCPNHHRCTHMIYRMVDAGATDEYILYFGQIHFDETFRVGFLDDLLTDYRLTKAALQLARITLSRWLVDTATNLSIEDL